MSQRDDRDWDVLAGEFVLGTLSEREQKLYDNIHRHDVDFQQRVTQWRERLAPLDAAVEPIAPDAGVWQAIQRELRFSESDHQRSVRSTDEDGLNRSDDISSVLADKLERGLDDSLNHSLDESFDNSLQHDTFNEHSSDLSGDYSADVSGDTSQNFDDTTGDFSSQQRPFPQAVNGSIGQVWRLVTSLASAAALVLAGFLWYLSASPPRSQEFTPTGFLSIIADETETPLWVVEGTSEATMIRLIALKPPVIAEDRAHELWLVKADNQGVVSLGLLPDRAGQTLLLPASIVTDNASGFAVSLEPEQGSPDDKPSGPILYQGGWRAIQLDS